MRNIGMKSSRMLKKEKETQEKCKAKVEKEDMEGRRKEEEKKGYGRRGGRVRG
jgi:hypothetical protein